MIVAIAGGVGGAKLSQGLLRALPADDLSVIVNTADDFSHLGLRISPDIDTVLYTLGGIANPIQGWGIAGDTYVSLEAIGRLGGETWFLLGDRDIATHIERTRRLASGETLSQVTNAFATALGISAAIIPMTNDAVATMVSTHEGLLDFQTYFVRRRQTDDVLGVAFSGIDRATPNPAALSALGTADAVVFCPSNPIVSVGPILAVPELRAAIAHTPGPIVAVSPIIGGKALKGPADRMMTTLGFETSAVGVAQIYHGLIDGIVIDDQDSHLADRIRDLGIAVHVTQGIMGGPEDRERLGREVLDFAATLTPAGHRA